MEIFGADNSAVGGARRVMGRRNYIAACLFSEDMRNELFSPGGMVSPGAMMTPRGFGDVGGRLSIAVDFIVQGEGAFTAPSKHGPVVIPFLEHGR